MAFLARSSIFSSQDGSRHSTFFPVRHALDPRAGATDKVTNKFCGNEQVTAAGRPNSLSYRFPGHIPVLVVSFKYRFQLQNETVRCRWEPSYLPFVSCCRAREDRHGSERRLQQCPQEFRHQIRRLDHASDRQGDVGSTRANGKKEFDWSGVTQLLGPRRRVSVCVPAGRGSDYRR